MYNQRDQPSTSKMVCLCLSFALILIQASLPVDAGRLTMATVNPGLATVSTFSSHLREYTELEERLEKGEKLPFERLIDLGLPNVHKFRKPFKYVRQLLAYLAAVYRNDTTISSDVKQRGDEITKTDSGRGFPISAMRYYTDPQGIPEIRDHVAKFKEILGDTEASPDEVFLTNGVSEATREIMGAISHIQLPNRKTGILLPQPNVLLHESMVSRHNECKGFYKWKKTTTDSCHNRWVLPEGEIERAFNETESNDCKVVAIVIVNPGNPLSRVLTDDELEMMIKFAESKNLIIIADEVYFQLLVDQSRTFTSVRRKLEQMGSPYNKIQLFSVFGASKGFLAEIGVRGGAFVTYNVDGNVRHILRRGAFNVKFASNVVGQVVMDVLVNPPSVGDQSYEEYQSLKKQTMDTWRSNVKYAGEILRALPNVKYPDIEGSPFAFVEIIMPQRAIDEATANGLTPESFYAQGLLDSTGIFVLPGDAFNIGDQGHFFRILLLVPTEVLTYSLRRITQYHMEFMDKYSELDAGGLQTSNCRP